MHLHDTPVDLMVADVNGPTLTLVDAIRNLERLGAQNPSDLPVIVLTARRGDPPRAAAGARL